MRCDKHGKDVQGHCQWCGIMLCKHCVAKSHQGKLFCEPCGKDLAPAIRNIQLKQLAQENSAEERRQAIHEMLNR